MVYVYSVALGTYLPKQVWEELNMKNVQNIK